MFERFTQDARNIIVIAQREAHELSHGYVGSEHLLLALTLDRGLAGDTLRQQAITHEAVRDQIVEIIGRGNTTPSGHSPFTPRSREILRQADEISRHHGHGFVGPAHLALAILANEDAVACLALKALDIILPKLGRKIVASFAGTYTAGFLFQGFTAAERGGRCDVSPLRITAEAAAEDCTGSQEVFEVRITLNAAEYFIILDPEPFPDSRRYLDYHQVRSSAARSGGSIFIAVPKAKFVTARTSAGTDVAIAETLEWEYIPLRSRLEVVSPAAS